MFAPKGAIVRTMRVSESETSVGEDGTAVERKRWISAPGVIVHIKPEVPGVKPSDVRRQFVRACRALGCLEPVVVERSHGHYARNGTAIAEGLPSAYQVMGPYPALLSATKLAQVERWEFAVSCRVPVVAGGSGPEKVRPPMNSAFGKPAQVRSTAEALARQARATARF